MAFDSSREGTPGRGLFVKNLDDDSPPRSIMTLDSNESVTQWPSDTLMVGDRGQAVRDLWMVNLSDPDSASAEVYLSSEANLRGIVVSPDGTLAAYSSNESGNNEIYIRSFPNPGERTVVSQGGGHVPFWSPDGNSVYYTRPEVGGAASTLMIARLQRNPVPVVLSTDSMFTPPGIIRLFQGSGLHPDGDRLIWARDVGSSDAAPPEPDRLIMVTNFFEELKERVPN